MEPDQQMVYRQIDGNSKLAVNRLYKSWHQARLPVVNYPAPIKNLGRSSSARNAWGWDEWPRFDTVLPPSFLMVIMLKNTGKHKNNLI